MAMAASKLTEVSLSLSLPLPPYLFSTPSRKPSFSLILLKPFSSSLRPPTKISSKSLQASNFKSPSPSYPSSSWLKKWPSPAPLPPIHYKDPKILQSDNNVDTRFLDEPTRAGNSAIERIVLRLRNLGLGSDDDEEEGTGSKSSRVVNSVIEEEKLGDLLKRDWVRPDRILVENEEDPGSTLLPWEKSEEERVGGGEEGEEEGGRRKRRAVNAPTLAELTIEDGELRRLRRMGMVLRERINIPKAGVTKEVLEKIHDKWRKSELVRLKFHEDLAHDMKTGHEIVERRTGGLVLWRSGSVMVVYRGTNYEGPPSQSQSVNRESDSVFVPDASSSENSVSTSSNDNRLLEKCNQVANRSSESITEEEAQFGSMLDGLGPRFEDWWGTGILPVDADLLPKTVPGYKTPFRLLPVGMRSRLTNAEMTNLRKLAKSLPCHFALGRNRDHQGLASAIVKLWEKSLIVKIAVKRGIQNTNNKLMAEELKRLTGGVLLLRNKYYIVMYRGKDFLPPSVATALLERLEMAKHTEDVEEKTRTAETKAKSVVGEGQALAGTLAEFYEARDRWGREVSNEEREKIMEEASRASTARVVKRLENKLALAQAKKRKAEKLLQKIVSSWVPVGPDNDQETITDEERVMFRRVGLRMKAYLPLGIRGVFDGVIENMHLHWKHRELVKLLSKDKELAFVQETGRLLEYESGGILVATERVPKGFVLIFYRGKNYHRPISIRPRNLLTKAKALKRRVALQRYEALSQHINELENTIEQTGKDISDPRGLDNSNTSTSEDQSHYNNFAELTHNEDEASMIDSDSDEDNDQEWENDEDNDQKWEDAEDSESADEDFDYL